ncbi:hypothetical protein SCALM49S_05634 [Streptomyces californicus]
MDTDDPGAVRRALAAVPDLAGLINTTDTWSVPAAELAAALGLPGADPASVRLLRDKRRVREALHAHGLSRGTAVSVPPGPEGAGRCCGRWGCPRAWRDSAGTSSRDVWIAHDEEALHRALAEAGEQRLAGGLFAEAFLAGPLYSAETLSWDGTTRLLGVLSRQTSRASVVREEAAAFPVALPSAERAGIEAWVGRVLAVAGHERGFAHVEFILTADGPELVEINRRIGGALVGEVLCRTLRTNVYTAMVDEALGCRPALLDAPLVAEGPGVRVRPRLRRTARGAQGLARPRRTRGVPRGGGVVPGPRSGRERHARGRSARLYGDGAGGGGDGGAGAAPGVERGRPAAGRRRRGVRPDG